PLAPPLYPSIASDHWAKRIFVNPDVNLNVNLISPRNRLGMNKILIAAVATILSIGTAQADLWSWSKNSKLEEKEGVSAYRVPTLGLDVRVYEWTPEGNPDVTCLMAWGTERPAGLQCFETKPRGAAASE
ncbi:hypothetical protein PAF17_16135, partial [Paracoccus sp. Z330]